MVLGAGVVMFAMEAVIFESPHALSVSRAVGMGSGFGGAGRAGFHCHWLHLLSFLRYDMCNCTANRVKTDIWQRSYCPEPSS